MRATPSSVHPESADTDLFVRLPTDSAAARGIRAAAAASACWNALSRFPKPFHHVACTKIAQRASVVPRYLLYATDDDGRADAYAAPAVPALHEWPEMVLHGCSP